MGEVREFRLPDLGEGLEEGEIVAWHIEVGDVIELNDVVADVETAKAVVEVPSPFAGRVVERLAEVGQSLAVGEVLVRIEAVPAADDAGTISEDTAEATASRAASEADGERASVLDADEEPQPLVGYGQGKAGPPRRRRRRRAGAAAAASPPASRPLAKPPVRKLAKDRGVDLAALMPGSGPDGVITRDDVLAVVEDTPAAGTGPEPAVATPTASPPAAAPASTARAAATEPAPTGTSPGGAPVDPRAGFRGRRPGEVEPLTGIRGRIASRMEVSRREIPEATCSRDADLTELWELRRDVSELAASQGHDVRISPFAVVLRATVIALRRFPTLNARIEGRDGEAPGEIHLLEPIHLGVAIDTERGLLVPVIHDAHQRSLLELAVALDELAAAARAGRLTPAQLTGGTFTVNNYGAFGNDHGDPVLNHPEAGILGVGAIRERPWVVHPHDEHGRPGPGELAVRRVATFTLAFDHRVCDGGEAGRFVTYVADLCERPGRLLLHA